MAAKRLVERVQAPFAGARVDRAAGVIYGVKLCGFESLNGRDYLPDTFRRDFRKYENAPINFNHGRERLVEDVGGRIKSPRVDADGTPRGDAHLLKSHPMYERVMESAEQEAAGTGPGLYGFSHVAMCKTGRGPNGRERVEGLDSVESVDLVAQPATTKGFFESRGKNMLTVRKLCEALVKHPQVTSEQVRPLKRLGEMDGMGDMPSGLDAPPADDADPADGVSAAFKAAIAAVVDSAMSGDMDPKDALGKIKKLLASHGELNADGSADDDGHPDSTDADDEPGDPKDEGVKRRRGGALLEAFDACAAAGFTGATSDDIQIVANTIAAGGEPAGVIERLKKTTEGYGREQPKSGTRTGTTTTTKPTTEAAIPTDSKGFKARYTE